MPDQDGKAADERITVVLPADVARALRERARREATPVSILIRRWIVERLQRKEATNGDIN